ncbi:KRAB-A domain-containing protein 2 [Araneus ventricosus]|uniref:KRAB-A domain-containing protein 2 n=1 Tax=Araneus ventricosus TaxID=182803 RepID=A0A4Y2XCD0_ARAVE|nr:KRAB-A domain-containing protein 2 [Araneus ventricosus]
MQIYYGVQDHLTKFVILKALTSKRAEEVACYLVDIFSLPGAPSILQFNNYKEFANNAVVSLKEFWPALKTVYGKPRHSQRQGSVGRANQDIKSMLYTWMEDFKSDRWREGLRLVHFMKNRAYHSGKKNTIQTSFCLQT